MCMCVCVCWLGGLCICFVRDYMHQSVPCVYCVHYTCNRAERFRKQAKSPRILPKNQIKSKIIGKEKLSICLRLIISRSKQIWRSIPIQLHEQYSILLYLDKRYHEIYRSKVVDNLMSKINGKPHLRIFFRRDSLQHKVIGTPEIPPRLYTPFFLLNCKKKPLFLWR